MKTTNTTTNTIKRAAETGRPDDIERLAVMAARAALAVANDPRRMRGAAGIGRRPDGTPEADGGGDTPRVRSMRAALTADAATLATLHADDIGGIRWINGRPVSITDAEYIRRAADRAADAAAALAAARRDAAALECMTARAVLDIGRRAGLDAVSVLYRHAPRRRALAAAARAARIDLAYWTAERDAGRDAAARLDAAASATLDGYAPDVMQSAALAIWDAYTTARRDAYGTRRGWLERPAPVYIRDRKTYTTPAAALAAASTDSAAARAAYAEITGTTLDAAAAYRLAGGKWTGREPVRDIYAAARREIERGRALDAGGRYMYVSLDDMLYNAAETDGMGGIDGIFWRMGKYADIGGGIPADAVTAWDAARIMADLDLYGRQAELLRLRAAGLSYAAAARAMGITEDAAKKIARRLRARAAAMIDAAPDKYAAMEDAAARLDAAARRDARVWCADLIRSVVRAAAHAEHLDGWMYTPAAVQAAAALAAARRDAAASATLDDARRAAARHAAARAAVLARYNAMQDARAARAARLAAVQAAAALAAARRDAGRRAAALAVVTARDNARRAARAASLLRLAVVWDAAAPVGTRGDAARARAAAMRARAAAVLDAPAPAAMMARAAAVSAARTPGRGHYTARRATRRPRQ